MTTETTDGTTGARCWTTQTQHWAVSRNVNERATGPTMTRQEGLALIDDVELDDAPDDSDEADGRRLTDHYDARHIPDSYDPEEGTTDGRSNREKLLAGETV